MLFERAKEGGILREEVFIASECAPPPHSGEKIVRNFRPDDIDLQRIGREKSHRGEIHPGLASVLHQRADQCDQRWLELISFHFCLDSVLARGNVMMRRCALRVCMVAVVGMLIAGPALAKDRLRSRQCADPATVAQNCIDRLNTMAANRAACLAKIADNATARIEALAELGQVDEAAACGTAAIARVDQLAAAAIDDINAAAEKCAAVLEALDEAELAADVTAAAAEAVAVVEQARADAVAAIEDAMP